MSSNNRNQKTSGFASHDKAGGRPNDQWLIRFESDQIKGPYSTEAVTKMILEGICSGQEDIASYPNGDWVNLNKQGEFYEALLESLENPVERDEKKSQKIDAETVIKVMEPKESPSSDMFNDLPSVPQDPDELFNFNNEANEAAAEEKSEANPINNLDDLKNLLSSKDVLADRFASPVPSVKSSGMNPVLSPEGSPLVLQQREMQKQQFAHLAVRTEEVRKNFRRKILPVALVAIVAVILVLIFGLSPKDNDMRGDAWTLRLPRKDRPQLSVEETQNLKKQAISFIRNGEINQLPLVQNHLLKAIEGKSNDIEAMGLLCVTYHMMWPYTQQNSSDLRSIATMAQSSRTVNPWSSFADACQTVYLISKGQVNDAISVLSRAVNALTDSQVIIPFLYVIRAELFEETEAYLNAESYYAEATRLFPNWLWPEFNMARVQLKANKITEAISGFQNLLKKKADYKGALYGLGIAAIKSGNDKVLAEKYFSQGFEIKGILPRSFHMEALREYVTILLDKNDKDAALAVAQYSLKVSPKDKSMKDIVIALGGEVLTGVDSEVIELMQIGNQYFRNGDYAAAQAQYRAAYLLAPDNTVLILKIAESLWKLGQSYEAHSWADKAIKVDAKLVAAYTLKSDYYRAQFNFLDAEKMLMAIRRFDPQNYNMLKSYAQLEYKKNNLQLASNLAEQAYRKYNADIDLLTLLVDINFALFVQMKANNVDAEKLEPILENIKKYAAKSIDLEPNLSEAQISYSKYIRANEGSYKSEQYLKNLVRDFQYNIDYRIALAELFESEEKYKSALEQYLPLANLDPKNYKVKLGIARCYKNINEYEQAQKYYLDAALLDANNAEPMFSLAELQLERGLLKKDMAEVERSYLKFERVSRINANYPKVYYYMARCLFEVGQYNQASELLKTEKQKNPNLADSYILQGQITSNQGKFKECATEFSSAAKLRISAEIYVKASECYRKDNDLDMSEYMISQAAKVNPNSPDIMRERGYFYTAKGEAEEGRKQFRLYLEHSPNAPDRNEIEKFTY